MTVTTGIKIALPGFDARHAPDYDLSFNSNWPMLQVVKTFNHTVTSADLTTADPAFYISTAAITLTHNLGYFAFADVWVYTNDTNFGGIVARRLNSQYGYTLYLGKKTMKIPTVRFLGDPNVQTFFSIGDVISVKVYSFDFTQAFSYSAISPPTFASTYDPHVGIKVVRSGRDIKSKDLRDLIIHSKGCAPQVLTIQTLENANYVTSTAGSFTEETVTYQIPSGIPARLDFLYSTDANSWKHATGAPSWNPTVVEPLTNVAYYATVYGEYDTQAVGDVSYTLTQQGLLTSFGLGDTVPFSIIVRRDPLLFSQTTVLSV